ncbi:MAG: GDP-L-fucose synthase [Planctomycetota bacterium]
MASLAHQRICVTGGAGFLGRVVCAKLRERGVREPFVPRKRDFDLTQADAVTRMFDAARPDVVIHLAAEVGGIGANEQHPGRFFYANMAMGLNLIEEARKRSVEKFVQVGTVCAYPKFCDLPFREESLWAGYPEETNAPYGVAKRALGVMLDAYRREYGFNGVYLIPVNLYGPGDNFDLQTSHVIAAMIRKFCDAVDHGRDVVECWGTGKASREFLYVEDAAEAIVTAAEVHNDPEPINLGSGREITIADLATLIARLCGFDGKIVWDAQRSDGQPRRRLDTTRAEKLLSWRAKVDLEEGLRRTMEWWRTSSRSRISMAASAG